MSGKLNVHNLEDVYKRQALCGPGWEVPPLFGCDQTVTLTNLFQIDGDVYKRQVV